MKYSEGDFCTAADIELAHNTSSVSDGEVDGVKAGVRKWGNEWYHNASFSNNLKSF
jgi:hypothetical protein